MTATRRQAREWAIQMLTAVDLNPPDDMEAFKAQFWQEIATVDESEGGPGEEVRGKLKRFAEERALGTLKDLDEIDKKLQELLAEWNLYRLGTVERAVLRMALWELKNTDVPKAVIINEAIDLANWFSSPKSRTLVNGVLDKYAKAL